MNIKKVRTFFNPYQNKISEVRKYSHELESAKELLRYFHWNEYDEIDPTPYQKYRYKEDLNYRKLRDLESLKTVVKNIQPNTILEIGTAEGRTTDMFSTTAPQATIHTMNIPPDEIHQGEGGKKTTYAYAVDEIGKIYKQNNRKNVRQILSNSATWKPDIENVDFAFIDGCHDADFVYNDTKKILPLMKPGGFILWHDFNPNLITQFSWVHDVCKGIDRLLYERYLAREILFVKNSWIGIYQVPKK